MCDCATKVNEQLRPHQTELDVSLMPNKKDIVRVNISTSIPYPIKPKRGQKPMRMVATYCPFCGKKYED